jgi:DNA polymerase-1
LERKNREERRMKHYLISGMSGVRQLVDLLLQRNCRLYADTETTGLNPRTCKLISVQIAVAGIDKAFVIDMREDTELKCAELDELRDLEWVFHNASFDWQVLANNGIKLRRPGCTKLAEQVIYGLGDEDARKSGKPLTLKGLVERYCKVELSKEERNWFIDLDVRPEWTEPFPEVELEYMAEDVAYLHRIYSEQTTQLQVRELTQTYGLEMKALPAICSIEAAGIRVNIDGWRAVIAEKEDEARELEGKVVAEFGEAIRAVRQREFDAKQAEYDYWLSIKKEYEVELRRDWDEMHGPKDKGWGDYKTAEMQEWRATHPNPGKPKLVTEVNIGSHVQMKQAFAELGIDLETTDKNELERALYKYPQLKSIIDFRAAAKFGSTYGESVLERTESDGRIHPGYRQLGTSTGRMSCSHPNWQNIPARTDTGAKLRHCVIAADGHKLLTADFPNIELRILAEMSVDQTMLDMFASGMDLHSFTARKMFNLPDEMTNDEVKSHRLPNGIKVRDIAKTINFGVAYGQSAFGFALKFGVTVDEAQGFIDQYYALYAQAGKWLEKRAQYAVENGFSKTKLGRRRYYEVLAEPKPKYSDDWKLWNRQIGSVKRAGKNHPIQGTSADMTKLALAFIYAKASEDWRIVACVHDEVVLEVPDRDVERAKAFLGEQMMKAARYFLKTVAIPAIEVNPADHWEH